MLRHITGTKLTRAFHHLYLSARLRTMTYFDSAPPMVSEVHLSRARKHSGPSCPPEVPCGGIEPFSFT